MSFSENIKKIREGKGLSQKALADKMGTSQSLIAAFENGTKVPSVRVVAEMAKTLNVTTDEIIFCGK